MPLGERQYMTRMVLVVGSEGMSLTLGYFAVVIIIIKRF